MESLNPAKCSQEIIRINDTLRTAAISSSSSSSSRGGGGGVEFLGCMPINLSRRNLLNVQRSVLIYQPRQLCASNLLGHSFD